MRFICFSCRQKTRLCSVDPSEASPLNLSKVILLHELAQRHYVRSFTESFQLPNHRARRSCSRSRTPSGEASSFSPLKCNIPVPPSHCVVVLTKIHYPGWESKWDEWVPRDRLRWGNERLARALKGATLAKGDSVEMWCQGLHVPGAWLEAVVHEVDKNRLYLGEVCVRVSVRVDVRTSLFVSYFSVCIFMCIVGLKPLFLFACLDCSTNPCLHICENGFARG